MQDTSATTVQTLIDCFIGLYCLNKAGEGVIAP